MKKIISAGLAIQDMLTDTYLLVKPHGGSTNGWGVPKGKRNNDELLIEAACRETMEETGLDTENIRSFACIDSVPFFHYTVRTTEGDTRKKVNKHVVVFHAIIDPQAKKNFKFNCTSFLTDGRPEIAEVRWATIDEAIELCVKSQKPIFEQLKLLNELEHDGFESTPLPTRK